MTAPRRLPPGSAPRAPREAGFTLIELLVVMTIMAILSGMLSVLLSLAQKKAKQTNTRAILMKVDQAIRLFRNDTGTYPYQTDLSTADVDPTKWTNNLGYRLAWKPANAAARKAYLDLMQLDLAIVHGCFSFKDGKNVGLPGGDGTHAFRFENYYSTPSPTFKTNLLLEPGSLALPNSAFGPVTDSGAHNYIISGWDVNTGVGKARSLTRMAEEISTLRYLSGQLPVEAPKGLDPADPADRALRPNLDPRYVSLCFQKGGSIAYTAYRYVPYNKPGAIADDSRGPVLPTALAVANGWRGEYLADALKLQPAASMPGEIDPTGTIILDAYRHPLVYVCSFSPGARGYTYAMGSGEIDEGDYGMRPTGRAPTTALASDIRTTAAPVYTTEFELWSPGPDGRFANMRDDAANRDNISLQAYTKDLR